MTTPKNPDPELAAAQKRIEELEKSNSELASDAAELAAGKASEREILKLMGKGLTREQAAATLKRLPIVAEKMKAHTEAVLAPQRAARKLRQEAIDKALVTSGMIV